MGEKGKRCSQQGGFVAAKGVIHFLRNSYPMWLGLFSL